MPDGLSGAAPRLLLTTDAVGGVWRYSVDLARGLSELGVEVVLAVLGPAANDRQREEVRDIGRLSLVQTGLPLDWTAENRAALDAAAERLAGLAALVGTRSVHLHAPALVGSARWPVPVVAVCHSCVGTWWRAMRAGAPPEDFAWRIAAAGEGLRRAAAVIAPSAAQAEAMRAVYGPLDVLTVHNGLPQSAPAPGSRPRAVLAAGRLWDEAKGLAVVDAVAAGVRAPVRAAGAIAGPGGNRVSFGNIELLGTLDAQEMERAYAGASVFVSMAQYEPFGLAVLEAARAGLRLVLSDIPTFRELWDGVAIFVKGPEALAAALTEGPGRDGRSGREGAGRALHQRGLRCRNLAAASRVGVGLNAYRLLHAFTAILLESWQMLTSCGACCATWSGAAIR